VTPTADRISMAGTSSQGGSAILFVAFSAGRFRWIAKFGPSRKFRTLVKFDK
jgi:hypothetical protein